MTFLARCDRGLSPWLTVGARLNDQRGGSGNRAGRCSRAAATASSWSGLPTRDRIVRSSRPLYKPAAKIISLGLRDMYLKANFQDFGRFSDIDMSIAGDGEASLPALTEAVKKLIDGSRKSAYETRGKRYAAARSTPCPTSSPRSRPTSPPTTTTRNRLSGPPPPTTSSPKSPADASPSKQSTNDETHH